MSKTYATTEEIKDRYWKLSDKGLERTGEEDAELINLILLMELFFPRRKE